MDAAAIHSLQPRLRKFLKQFGKFGEGTAGSNSTTLLGQPTDVAVDAKTNEVYFSDGYTNRRVIVFDVNTGAYKRHWGAFGKPPDDAPLPAFNRSGPVRQQFDTPHCLARACQSGPVADLLARRSNPGLGWV